MTERLLKNENTVRDMRGNTGIKLFNFRPALFCAVFLCLGILFGYARETIKLSYWWLCAILPLGALLFFFSLSGRNWRKKIGAYVLLLSVFFTLGACFSSLQMQTFSALPTYEGEHAVLGLVVDKQGVEENYSITISSINVDGIETDGSARVYVSKAQYETVSLADEVLVCGEMRTYVDFHNDYGVRAQAIEERCAYYVTATSTTVMQNRFSPFLFVRERLTKVLGAGMDETPAAVMTAVLTGNTTGMDEGLLTNIRRGGIAHIFAVSGLHIGALYAFCLLLLDKTGLRKTKRFTRVVFTASVLLLYGGICGFSSSVIRAIVMCLSFYVAKLLGEKTDGLETLGVAACIVLLLSPISLFSVGFQLSFAACLGIVIFSRSITDSVKNGINKLRDKFGKKKEVVLSSYGKLSIKDTHPLTVGQRLERAATSFLGVTLSAQLCTAPIQLLAFGYLSGWGLLLNVLFVPLISAAFSFLLALALLACVLPVAWSFVVLYVPNVIWSALLLLFETFDFSTFVITLGLSATATSCYYSTILLCSEKCNLHRKEKWWIFGVGMAVFVVCLCV